MKILLFISVLLFVSCAPEKGQRRSGFEDYTYTVSDLKSDKGEPKSTVQNELNDEYEMYHYEDETYQVSGHKVIAKYRNPSEKEENIQYWRHHLKSDYYKIAPSKSQGHTKMYVLSCQSKGLTIYFNGEGDVKRIAQSLRRRQ